MLLGGPELIVVKSVFQVEGKLWQFFAVTIPATILVLVVYELWRRTREARLAPTSQAREIELSVVNQGV
jgi:hypothetical protein